MKSGYVLIGPKLTSFHTALCSERENGVEVLRYLRDYEGAGGEHGRAGWKAASGNSNA